ncbi:MAG: hypothetical protein ACP5JJ_12315, partial [Anaerolineae bacterium]
EMYNYVRQVLETMKQHNLDLDHALGMHGHNMTKDEVREIIAEERAQLGQYDGFPDEEGQDRWPRW